MLYFTSYLYDTYVASSIIELTRVARAWLFVKISNRGESNRMDLATAPYGVNASDTFAAAVRKRHGRELSTQLHSTVRNGQWWIDQFARAGFRHHHNVKLVSWACCGLVLHKERKTRRHCTRIPHRSSLDARHAFTSQTHVGTCGA